MQEINQTLAQIRAMGVLPTAVETNLELNIYQHGGDLALSRFRQKQPLSPQLKIYYPVDYLDEFPPSPMVYQGGLVSTQDLMRTVWALYRTPLPPTSVQAYLQKNPFVYQLLRSLPQPKLLDVLLDRILVVGFQPYLDGWQLVLAAP